MARNRLSDLNDYLFEQIERINDDELHGEELKEAVQKAKTINDVARTIVQNASVMLQGVKVANEFGLAEGQLPAMIESPSD